MEVKYYLTMLFLLRCIQINRRMEFVFASHSFDVWESWKFEGSLEECRLVNCRNPSVSTSLYNFTTIFYLDFLHLSFGISKAFLYFI